MAQLFTTQYPNTIRAVIAGDPVSEFVYPADVVLNCNTSGTGLPFSINLLEIPANYWSTQYKLYINDTGNNASVRNIVINAPAGQTINGASSYTINTNGGGVIIRILDNGAYIVQANPNTGSGTPCCDFVVLTNAQLLALISAGTIDQTKFYYVTDPQNAVAVLVHGVAAATNTSIQGFGLFYNADYDGTANYSGVPGFSSWKNIWVDSTTTVVAGDVVVWNNRMWVNLTGVWGNQPDLDSVNWQALSASATTGYFLVSDAIRYNAASNRVIYRADAYNNEVEDYTNLSSVNSLDAFTWGGGSRINGNKVVGGGIMNICNSYISYQSNIVTGFSLLSEVGFKEASLGTVSNNVVQNNSELRISGQLQGDCLSNTVSENSLFIVAGVISASSVLSNSVQNNSDVRVNKITGVGVFARNIVTGNSILWTTEQKGPSISQNSVSSGASVKLGTVNPTFSFDRNTFANGRILLHTTTTFSIVEKVCVDGRSTIPITLDFSDSSIWNGSVLTIPTVASTYAGIFNCTNTGGGNVRNIANLPTRNPSRFTVQAGATMQVSETAIGSAVATEIVGAAAPVTLTLVGRINGGDFIELEKEGTFNAVINANIKA